MKWWRSVVNDECKGAHRIGINGSVSPPSQRSLGLLMACLGGVLAGCGSPDIRELPSLDTVDPPKGTSELVIGQYSGASRSGGGDAGSVNTQAADTVDTGASGDTTEPSADTSVDSSAPEPADSDPPPAPPSCENPPAAPILKPELLPACCPGAHCVPAALVPESQASLLDTCSDGDGYCVPDPLIESSGFYTPPTCVSVGGSEGRCTSTCVPAVAAQAKDLPVDICGENEVCAPCCDPYTGESTGACDTTCDVGPAAGYCEAIFTPCCSGIEGHCIAPAQVPADKQGNLETCDNGFLCVPDVMQDLSFKGSPCSGTMLLGDWYWGVCLPKCLKLPFEFAMDTSGCPSGWVCAPCEDPFFGAPTGAPGCG